LTAPTVAPARTLTHAGAGTAPVETGSGSSPARLARAAGLLYLAIFVCGLFSELAVRSRMIVDGDPTATAANILESETLFRLGLVTDLVMVVCDVALAIVLYALLKPVSSTISLMAAAFRLIQAAVLGSVLLNHIMAVELLTTNDYVDADGAATLASLSLDRHMFGYLLGLVFFAVDLFLLGWLVWRSGFLPKALGALLAAGGAAYLLDSLSYFLVSGYDGGVSPVVLAPAVVAELAMILWLLVKGVDTDRWEAMASDRPILDREATP
jgi:hypothetical protein